MSILSGYERRKKTIATEDGNHKLISEWTHAGSVELSNGLTLDESTAKWDAKQDESTAINTSNIGNQSVNYATSAGSANSVAWDKVTGKPNTYTPASHEHNYAGSSSAGGAATSANKLNTNAGDANTPVYFSNGVPVACTSLDLNTSGSAAKLTTSRTINGTSFDGSANITTANWGTTRTLTIGSTSKSVNGSGNVSWSLSEIGAASSSHTHNYAGSDSAGGTATKAHIATTAAYIGSAANTSKPMEFEYTAKTGSPSHVWGIDSNGKSWAYSPSNMSVNYASTANYANTAGSVTNTLPINLGGTGATTAASARTQLGITPANIGAASSSHTHNYAGSSSAGGIATLAIQCKNASGNVDLMTSTSKVRAVNASASAYASIEASAFTNMSSRLVKENIADIAEEKALKLLDINIVSFDYKEKFGGRKGNFGAIAEDVKEIIPYAVEVPEDYNEDLFDEEKGISQPTLSVDYTKFVPHLIKMVQIQHMEIEALRQEFEKLKTKVS